jgi:hypothetical protein
MVVGLQGSKVARVQGSGVQGAVPLFAPLSP